MESFPTNLLPSLTDAAVSVPPEQATIGASPTEQFYVAHNRSVLVLAVLCVGLRDGDGNLMFDPSEKPWKSMKKKTVNPSTKDMRDEVQRRWDAFVAQSLLDKDKEKGPPATKYWDKKQLEKWLGDHPINGIEDVSFLCRVIAERKETSENAKKDDEWESEQLNTTTHVAATDEQGKKYKKWSGPKPYQRLLHALVDFADIKYAYIHRDDAPSGRMVIENRKTKEAKEANVWSMVEKKWNDPNWACDTEAPDDLHPDFIVSETITHEDVSEFLPLTAERAKDRYESLMTQLKRIIPKWEKSGQGDGGHEGNDNDEIQHEKSDENNSDSHSSSSSSSSSSSVRAQQKVKKWGEFKNRSRFAMLKLRDFFKGSNSYVLYAWYVIQKHDLITCSMNMLADGVCSRDGARGIPSVITRRKDDDDDDGDEGSLDTTGRSSIGSAKSRSASSTSVRKRGATDGDEEGDVISASIREHGTKLVQYAKINADESKRNREYAQAEAKRHRIDDISAAIDKLKAEKRGLLIQLASIPPGSNNTAMEEVYKSSIAEIDADIKAKEQAKEEARNDVPTPIRNNCTPP